MATLSVTANSRKSRPTMPPISRMGMNTAKQRDGDRDDGKADLLGALERGFERAACPARCRRVMFSVTTMASSTTKPVEMVSAISDRLSRL